MYNARTLIASNGMRRGEALGSIDPRLRRRHTVRLSRPARAFHHHVRPPAVDAHGSLWRVLDWTWRARYSQRPRVHRHPSDTSRRRIEVAAGAVRYDATTDQLSSDTAFVATSGSRSLPASALRPTRVSSASGVYSAARFARPLITTVLHATPRSASCVHRTRDRRHAIAWTDAVTGRPAAPDRGRRLHALRAPRSGHREVPDHLRGNGNDAGSALLLQPDPQRAASRPTSGSSIARQARRSSSRW